MSPTSASSGAVSLHVYGLDYRHLGSSILETFDSPDRRAGLRAG